MPGRYVAAGGEEFARTGYDVVDPPRPAPGRYETQEGFGWTNGIYAALDAGR